MIVLIDNFDSFAHNLARYFSRLHPQVQVVRNDNISLAELEELNPQLIALSPGPCRPEQAGICVDVIRQFGERIPIFGVCLGHQAIATAFDGKIIRAEPCHGTASLVTHQGGALFTGIPSPFPAGRYHSLVVDRDALPPELKVIAETENGAIMAIQHHDRPIVGVQFHPESILTADGYRLLANMLAVAGIASNQPTPPFESEYQKPVAAPDPTLTRPLTF